MKHEVTTFHTKKMLAESLKKAMGTKQLSKITVSEIISDCGINRNTFYYHFEDIYALLKWVLEEEAVEVVKSFDLLTDYEDALFFIIQYVEENKHILNCAYDSMGRDRLKSFFYTDFVDIIGTLVDSIETSLKLAVPAHFKVFLCHFYSEALAAVLVDLFKDGAPGNQQQTVDYLSLILKSSIPQALLYAEALYKPKK